MLKFSDEFEKMLRDIIKSSIEFSLREAFKEHFYAEEKLDVRQAANYLNVSVRTIRKMKDRGQLKKANPFVKKLIFNKTDLDKLDSVYRKK